MEDSLSFIYQTFWKDGKHYHLLDLTWTELHSFGISAPTFPEILNGFWVLWELGRAVTVSISQTEGEVAEDVNGKPEVLLECIWMQDLPERSTPHPLHSFKNQAPWAFCSHLFALALLPLSLPRPPPSLYMSSWLRHKDSVSQFQMILKPHMLCSAHFPTPQRQSLVAKIKMRKGWRERETWGRVRQCMRTRE